MNRHKLETIHARSTGATSTWYAVAMQTLAIASRKGGVGKTSVAVGLAAAYHAAGAATLLVDLDPQGNATRWLLGDLPALGALDAMTSGARDSHLCPDPRRPGLDLLPATRGLAALDAALADEVGAETVLRSALLKWAHRYDVAVVDCPPALGLATVNALVAADAVVSPVVAGYLPLLGLEQLDEALERARARLRAKARHLGCILFAADEREAVTGETRALLGARLLGEVRTSTAAKTLPAHRLTQLDQGADERGAADFRSLLGKLRAQHKILPASVARKKRR